VIYSTLNIPQSHLNCTFDNYDFSDGKKLLRDHLDKFVAGSRKGIVFIGKPGVGKTHLLVSSYFALQNRDVLPGSQVIYFDYQELLNYLREGFSSSIRADTAVNKLCSVEYLLVDDIKPESTGEFWHQILTQIIEYSYNAKTKLMLSTNADSQEELVERWRLSDYHLSRLIALCDIVTLKGVDRRMTNA